jgi:general secretion pathway protein B
MSLILEALKKSEQQRRLGEAPTLGSPVVATRRRRNLLPVIAILIVLAAAAAWWLTRPAPSARPAAPAASETEKPIAAAPPAQPVTKVPPTAPVAKPRSGSATLLPEATMQRREARAEKLEVEKRAAAAAKAGTAPGAAATATPPVPKPALPPAPVAKPAIAPPAPTKPAVAGTSAAPVAPPAALKPADKAAHVPATPKAANAASLPSIWDLPYSTRKDLPEIDLTMHVYSSDPASRFVVIKGTRHIEGEELGQDLFLREIRQDGLVLEFKGERFFFPRNGR